MTTLQLNGTPVTLEAPADTPLLWALRDGAGLKGTKFGCGVGLCGACTVLIDGQAVRSCQTALGEAAGKAVTTIEGLDPQGRHPLQQAWIEAQAPQCGYCQSGQILQAAVLLREKPQPSDADIDAAMQGNLCRCMAYVRIRKAIHLAAQRLQQGGPHG